MTKHKIVLVPFPFDDLSQTKLRPAVCLTDPIGRHRHVVLAFVSSQIPAELLDNDLVIDEAHAEFGLTGLRTTSTLRLHRLMTVTTGLILRELGELPQSFRLEVDVRLRRLFQLENPLGQ